MQLIVTVLYHGVNEVPKFNEPRLKDWSSRFNTFMRESRKNESLRLDWENHVCASWSADCVQAITGVDPYKVFRSVASPKDAVRAIKGTGHRNLADLMYDYFYEVPITQAQRGDICIIEATPQTIFDVEVIPVAVGIVDAPNYWAIGEDGLCVGQLNNLAVKACFVIGDVASRGIMVEKV